MKNNWNDFIEIYDWEFELINDIQKKDIDLWISLCSEYGSMTLEIGAGTGRITLPLAEKGINIIAMDNSTTFISKLEERNKYVNLIPILGDMRDFAFDRKFTFCFLGYTTFQYLLTKDDQIACLKNVNKVLKKGARLALDLDPTLYALSNIQKKALLYREYFPIRKCYVSMLTSHSIDRARQIVTWEDDYIFHGLESQNFSHTLSLKMVDIKEIDTLLEETGFKVESVFGGFSKEIYTKDSDRLIIVATKEH